MPSMACLASCHPKQGAAFSRDGCAYHRSLRELYNLSALTPVASAYTATDGTLTANTSKDGLLGSKVRIKYTTSGTYAGNSTLQIDVQWRSRTQP